MYDTLIDVYPSTSCHTPTVHVMTSTPIAHLAIGAAINKPSSCCKINQTRGLYVGCFHLHEIGPGD